MNKWTRNAILAIILITCVLAVAGCSLASKQPQMKSAGLLLPETINDQVWGTKGYKGLLQIHSTFDVDVYYREDINTEERVRNVVEEFHNMGVNFIIGHGEFYANCFNEISEKYPDIQFVTLNGEAKNKNTTSLIFEGYAMGYFGGMIAAEMSNSNVLGIIGAYETQQEIKGFIEGAKYRKPSVETHVAYVGDWDDVDKALELAEDLLSKNVDVFYPAGDGFNVPVIEKAKEEGAYVIGYISEQQDFGERTVLTSTVQEVEKLIMLAAEQFNAGELKSGNLYFDFEDGVIALGKYSPLIPKEFRDEMDSYVADYIDTGKLPGKEK